MSNPTTKPHLLLGTSGERSPHTSPMATCCYALISHYATSSLGLSTKFSKSINFLVKCVLHFFKTNLSLRVISRFGYGFSFAELLQRNRSYLKQKGRRRDRSDLVITVYFWKAGGRLRSTSSSTVGPKPVVFSAQPCWLSAWLQSCAPVP